MADIEKLKAFYIMGECGSYRSAAARIGITQPALTKRLSYLQSEMNVSLFVPDKRPATMSEAGKYLWDYLDRNLDGFLLLDQKMASFSDKATGLITIACRDILPSCILTPVIKGFTDLYPKISFELVSVPGNEIASYVDKGKADIALTLSSQAGNLLQPVSASKDHRLGLLIPSDREEASRNFLNPKDLAGKPVILPFEKNCATEIHKTFEESGYVPGAVHWYTDLDTCLSMVEAGLGTAFIPQETEPFINTERFSMLYFAPKVSITSAMAVRRRQVSLPSLDLFVGYLKTGFR
ncbi:MAG: LysR family transcriptional regulator [Clostridiales bacterium]|nr:LysR family transcriptional regulator [Clostridiales bacterium]